jgi:hypothetical protein
MQLDRLISIILLLGALVYTAFLPPDYSPARFALAGIIVLAGLIWLAKR